MILLTDALAALDRSTRCAQEHTPACADVVEIVNRHARSVLTELFEGRGEMSRVQADMMLMMTRNVVMALTAAQETSEASGDETPEPDATDE